MAENRVGRRVNKVCGNPSPCRAGGGRDPGQSPQRRQARVTVTYNRDELQRRLEVERWIDRGLDRLYRGEEDMPEEVNIDELLDLKTDEERTHRLQVTVPPMCYTQPGRRTGALGGDCRVSCEGGWLSLRGGAQREEAQGEPGLMAEVSTLAWEGLGAPGGEE
ncbi:protein phosphatase 1 regulatory subunit 14A-like [Oreochromis aureus]|uniref:protein phosphatase 1 regulatory subunit 14A-like n=1 Tax=Oreochromis aureus TaxID=47969 RepID=UPI001954DCCC|nr:protein phosphatase 1 regulatory subunit 14A-like [Oreochromis aureus]